MLRIKGSSFPTRRSCWVTCWWVCREDTGKALRSPLPRVQGSLLKYELNYLPAPRNISLPYFCHRTPNGPMRLQLHLEAPLILSETLHLLVCVAGLHQRRAPGFLSQPCSVESLNRHQIPQVENCCGSHWKNDSSPISTSWWTDLSVSTPSQKWTQFINGLF